MQNYQYQEIQKNQRAGDIRNTAIFTSKGG